MIGFQPEFHADEPQADEGYDTKNLSKKELYEFVSRVYMLPPVASKGLTRDYLLQVHKGDVFRVPIGEFKHFEVDLSPDMERRVGTINNSILVKKLNILLQETGRKPLGFTEFEIPEQVVALLIQKWLYKVARYIDKTSLTEFFEYPVEPEPPLSKTSSAISQIFFGRLYASQFFFRERMAKQSKRLWEALKVVSETYRTWMNQTTTVEILEYELRQTKEKLAQLHGNLEDLIGKASFTYTAIINPNVQPGVMLEGGDSFTADMRAQLKLANTL